MIGFEPDQTGLRSGADSRNSATDQNAFGIAHRSQQDIWRVVPPLQFPRRSIQRLQATRGLDHHNLTGQTHDPLHIQTRAAPKLPPRHRIQTTHSTHTGLRHEHLSRFPIEQRVDHILKIGTLLKTPRYEWTPPSPLDLSHRVAAQHRISRETQQVIGNSLQTARRPLLPHVAQANHGLSRNDRAGFGMQTGQIQLNGFRLRYRGGQYENPLTHPDGITGHIFLGTRAPHNFSGLRLQRHQFRSDVEEPPHQQPITDDQRPCGNRRPVMGFTLFPAQLHAPTLATICQIVSCQLKSIRNVQSLVVGDHRQLTARPILMLKRGVAR